jgi:hypothetical protein
MVPFFRAQLRLLSCLLVGCTLGWAGVVHADVPISDKARESFNAGVNYMQDPDGAKYEDAYREFKAAYADSPSWKILGNLGIVAMKLERDGEAIEAFKAYLAEGGANLEADERAQFERDLSTLKAGVVTINITTTPPGAQIIDERIPAQGQPIRNVYEAASQPLRLGIHAGRHRITARLAGYTDQVWELDARSGANESHAFELAPVTTAAPAASGPASIGTPASDVTRPVPTSVYIGLAATGACAIGFAVTGILAKGKHDDFNEKNDGLDPQQAQELKDSGEQLNLFADVFLGATVVAGGITAILYATRPAASPDRGHNLRMQPLVGNRAGGLVLSGAF